MHFGIKNQRQNGEPFIHNGAEVRIVAAGEGSAGFLNVERAGLFAEINEVIEIFGDEPFADMPSGVGLFVTHLLVRVEILQMVNELGGAVRGELQDIGQRAGRRRGKEGMGASTCGGSQRSAGGFFAFS